MIKYSIIFWLYSPLLDLGRFLSFLIYTQSVGLLGRGISLLHGLYLHTERHEHRINAYRHPYIEWDTNPWPQCLSGRRQFMPQTARPLWSAMINYRTLINRPFVIRYSQRNGVGSNRHNPGLPYDKWIGIHQADRMWAVLVTTLKIPKTHSNRYHNTK
jgi:hypothetical protein